MFNSEFELNYLKLFKLGLLLLEKIRSFEWKKGLLDVPLKDLWI